MTGSLHQIDCGGIFQLLHSDQDMRVDHYIGLIGSSLRYMVSTPNWIRKELGLGLIKSLRPSLIFKVNHLLLFYCCALVAAIHARAYHCHSCVINIINRVFLLALIKLCVTNFCLVDNCPLLFCA